MDMTQTWYATAAAAWGCYAFGIWTFRLSRGEPLFLAVAKMALVACPVILSCFGIHATRRYQFILATTSIPVVEVASSDNGRERTIERIDDGTGITIEREHIAGWQLVSAAGRGHETDRRLSRRAAGNQGCCRGNEGREGQAGGCVCGILGVPGCCEGCGRDCACESLSDGVFGIRF